MLPVYLADIVLNFRTSYFNKEGEECTRSKLMAQHYLKHGFVLDIVCVLPFRIMGPSFGILALVKLTRVF